MPRKPKPKVKVADPKLSPEIEQAMAEAGAAVAKLKMQSLANIIHMTIPEGWGFALWTFKSDVPDGTRLYYISSAHRDDVFSAMQEWLEMVKREAGLEALEGREKLGGKPH